MPVPEYEMTLTYSVVSEMTLNPHATKAWNLFHDATALAEWLLVSEMT